MKRALFASLVAVLCAPAAPAQSSCTPTAIRIEVEPANAPQGTPIDVTLTNDSTDFVVLFSTCVFEGVFAGSTCPNSNFVGGPGCGDALTILAPGESATTTWSGFDDSGNVAPLGDYSFRIIYESMFGFTECCAFANVGPGPGTSSCNGDGGDQMGCTPCPCGNEAAPGTTGGCLNSAGSSAQLVAEGTDSITNGNLRMELGGATPLSFAVLVSGSQIAPTNPQNPCFGQNSGVFATAFDGLRCASQDILRHGPRPTDAQGGVGETTNGWGSPSPSIPAASGFVAGQTRHFQGTYRDQPGTVCLTQANTSQAVSITFTP